ncbi:MAG TPA: helix-turn-helix transcriptional regulator [Gordonia sp. (in: high G+C Gram-positive bacteria)]|jgi:transcriptional regulator with XRE-family HTH domain|nr:helix-turn-helix transcriptional regulator [Gordonia sp. (in: high G+C Gram-positive bacteria)]
MTATGYPLGTPEDVIARLVHARITAGLSQATVGQRMGTPHASAISAVENHRRNPGLDWLTRYATAVGHIIAVIPTPQENP